MVCTNSNWCCMWETAGCHGNCSAVFNSTWWVMLTQWCWIDHGLASTSILLSPCQGYKEQAVVQTCRLHHFWFIASEQRKKFLNASRYQNCPENIFSPSKKLKKMIKMERDCEIFITSGCSLFFYVCTCQCIFNVDLLKKCGNMNI